MVCGRAVRVLRRAEGGCMYQCLCVSAYFSCRLYVFFHPCFWLKLFTQHYICYLLFLFYPNVVNRQKNRHFAGCYMNEFEITVFVIFFNVEIV